MVVMAFRSSWFIVTETDEFIGRLRETSRLPQYLMTAMFDGAEWVAVNDMAKEGAVLKNQLEFAIVGEKKKKKLKGICGF